jgi:hypothetical protein
MQLDTLEDRPLLLSQYPENVRAVLGCRDNGLFCRIPQRADQRIAQARRLLLVLNRVPPNR